MKGHSVVMQDDFEDKMFKELLGDYTKPAADDGFSEYVLANLEAQPNHSRLKTILVGGAGVIGAAIAGLQLPGLWHYLTGLKVPAIQPIAAPQVDAGMFSSTYGMMVFAMIAVLMFWVGNNILFGEDM
jgi:hypothetical protein